MKIRHLSQTLHEKLDVEVGELVKPNIFNEDMQRLLARVELLAELLRYIDKDDELGEQ